MGQYQFQELMKNTNDFLDNAIREKRDFSRQKFASQDEIAKRNQALQERQGLQQMALEGQKMNLIQREADNKLFADGQKHHDFYNTQNGVMSQNEYDKKYMSPEDIAKRDMVNVQRDQNKFEQFKFLFDPSLERRGSAGGGNGTDAQMLLNSGGSADAGTAQTQLPFGNILDDSNGTPNAGSFQSRQQLFNDFMGQGQSNVMQNPQAGQIQRNTQDFKPVSTDVKPLSLMPYAKPLQAEKEQTPDIKRASPQVFSDNNNGGTFFDKVKQNSNSQNSSQPFFREFNFDPEKKKKVYPRAGSGNMWSR